MALPFSDGTQTTGATSTTDHHVFNFATEAQSAQRTREDLHGLLLSFPTGPKKAGIVLRPKEVISPIIGGLCRELKINLKN
jgi:hypothetical protein